MIESLFDAGFVGGHVEGGSPDRLPRGPPRLGEDAREDDIDWEGPVDRQEEARRFRQIHRNMGQHVDHEWVGPIILRNCLNNSNRILDINYF